MGTPRSPMKRKILEFAENQFDYNCETGTLRVYSMDTNEEQRPFTFTAQGIEELRAALRSISKPVDE